jgi:hypothetical protein
MANTGFYNIDLNKLSEFLLPPKFRGFRITAWMRTIMAGLVHFLTTIIDTARNNLLDSVKVNSQKIVFENWLNNYFGTLAEKIYIDNLTDLITARPMFNEAEGKPLFMYNESEAKPVYMYNEAEIGTGVGFKVWYPAYIGTAGQLQQLIAEIERIKVEGTSYTTQAYGSTEDPR